MVSGRCLTRPVPWLALAALTLLACGPAEPGYPLRVASGGHLAPKAGETVTLWALRSSQVVMGATWAIDEADRGKATLVPALDAARCGVHVLQPGTIRVTATWNGGSGAAVLVAAPEAPSWQQLPFEQVRGINSYTNAPVAIRGADEWARYWQGVIALNGQQLAVPALPEVDFGSASLVVVGATLDATHARPVLARVEPGGEGLVEVGLPEGDQQETTIGSLASRVEVYRVPRLPATTRVLYACHGCPPGPTLPSPAPFAAIAGQALVVGQPVELPATGQGVPLTWALAPRTAGRATLEGRHLVPTAPGALVLTATAGTEAVTVIDAVAASADLERPLYAELRASLTGGPRVLRSQAEWKALWDQLFYPPGTGADQPWTAPPPPPDPPQVDFATRNVLAVELDTGIKPAITSIEGGRVVLTRYGIVRAGQSTPQGAPSGSVAFYDVPPLAGTPAVSLEAVPEAP